MEHILAVYKHPQLGVCSMMIQRKQPLSDCPATCESVGVEVKAAFDEVVRFCRTCEAPFGEFEKQLLVRVAVLGAWLIRLFLTARHERLDLQPFLEDGKYRPGHHYAERTLKTFYGAVRYGRHYLIARGGGSGGFFPLDVVLGLTRDRLSPWVMQWVARLATRMSFKAAQMVCQAGLNWAPATETIEQIVLGMGREAAPFMKQLKAPAADGDVLIIEIDGKCPPTATEAELAKRRGQRRPKHAKECACGCQRHRGQDRRTETRQRYGPKKRRKRGQQSKNGKEVVVVVMYTLQRGADGKLHGPIGKKLYGTFAGCQAGADWARAEASKRGFGPHTTQTVQVVCDGSERLQRPMQQAFPHAIFTLDVWHVVEKLWKVGRRFYGEGSAGLRSWVEGLKPMLFDGREDRLLARLQAKLASVPLNGPGTKPRRESLRKLIAYLKKHREQMHYRDRMVEDLVIATGQVEGAVRHLVGERFDCAGMRWRQEKAEALLHLRCVELNGDWQTFVRWFEAKNRRRLRKGERRRVLTEQPINLKRAA
jgi:hypothetical protein